jgi:hypothetical protein
VSADRRLVFEITGDASGWALAVKDAQNLNTQATANATTLNNNLKRLDEERATNYIASVKAMASAFIAFMAVQEVQKGFQVAMTAASDYGHALEQTAQIMNTTVQNAAVLRFTFTSLGLDADATAKMVATLTRNMEHNTAEFEALGVATHDAQGHLRNAFDVITDLQAVVSKAGNDNDKLAVTMATVARAAGVSAGSIAGLEQFLSLTKEQMDANKQAAEALGLVWDEKTTKAAADLWHEQKTLDETMKAAGITISQALEPAVEWLTHAFLVGTEVMKNWILGLVAIGGAVGAVFKGDIKGAIDSAHQALVDFGSALDFNAIIAKVDHQIALGKLAEQLGNQKLPGPVTGGGGGNTAVQDAQAELRAILEKYLAEKQAAIDAINAEKEARNVAFNERIDQLNEAETARKAAHADAIAAIQEEMQTLSDELALRQRGRDDQVAGLRAQIALLDQALAIETAQDQLAKDQRALQVTTSEGPVTMRRGEHIEDYYKRVHDHEIKLADEKKKIEDDKEKIVRDAQKVILEDQIKSIEAIAKADQRALEDKKKAAADEIKGIELVQKAEAARSAASIKDLREQMKVADAASVATIKGLQAEMKAEKERIDDQVLQLGKLLKAHQGFAGGVSAGLDEIGAAAAAAAANVDALNAALANVHERARNPDLATANQGTTSSASGHYFSPSTYSGHNMPAPPATPFGLTFEGILNWLGTFHNTQMPTETHAAGGSMVLSQPTALLGLSTGRASAVAGAGETVTITPRGGRSAGGGLVVQVVMPNGLVLAQVVMPHVRAELAMEDAIANASGAVRRS